MGGESWPIHRSSWVLLGPLEAKVTACLAQFDTSVYLGGGGLRLEKWIESVLDAFSGIT